MYGLKHQYLKSKIKGLKMYLKSLEKEKLKHIEKEVFKIKTEIVEVDNNVEKLGKSKSGSLKRPIKLTTSFQL